MVFSFMTSLAVTTKGALTHCLQNSKVINQDRHLFSDVWLFTQVWNLNDILHYVGVVSLQSLLRNFFV